MTPFDKPGQDRLPVSVVVATRDRPEALGEALGAVRAAMGADDELIVVDSASTDPRVAEVAAELGADVVRSTLPGACRARNLGWRAARHGLVAFTDDDCLPDPDWLARIGGCFAATPGAAFLTGRVLPAGADAAVGGARPRRAQLSVSLHLDDRSRPIDDVDEADEVGHGANMAWRRSALEALGGFDEALGPGAPLRAAEDADLVWRALEAGMTGRYEPAVVVAHRQWRRRGEQLAAYYAYGVGEGAVAVKRWRMDGREVRPAGLATHFLLNRGLPAAARRLAAGYEMGALADLARAAGAVRGGLLARRRPLAEGRFAP
jgi:glycosyltransferase involved in cell wall biosynthesis